jgi:hypothetical protein
VNIRAPTIIELDFYAAVLGGLFKSRQAILIEDTGPKRALQHGHGIGVPEPFREIGEQAERIRPERRRKATLGYFQAGQSTLLERGDDARCVLSPQFLDSRAIAGGQGKCDLFAGRLPITSLYRAAATCQRHFQPNDDRCLEALVLG